MAAKARKSASKTPTKKPAPKAKPAATAQRPLTPKMRVFVAEYLKDANGTQAAIRAGYSKATAGSQAERLLKKVEIRRAVDEALSKVEAKCELSVERTLREIARIAYFDARKLFNADGSPKKLTELDDDTAAAIQGIDVATIGNEEIGIGQVLKYKAADKNSALDKAMKHFGQYERDNKQANPGDALASLLGKISASGSRLPVAKRGKA